MLVVVASYRQNVHAYPSGGGDYEVATTNLGPRAGLTVASALLVDYVLTVAVSVSSGVAERRRGAALVRGHEVPIAVGARRAADRDEPARGPRVRQAFAVPIYVFMLGIIGMAAFGFIRAATGTLPQADSAQYDLVPEQAGTSLAGFADAVPAAARVLLRLRGADRCRGDLQRRARVQEAQEPQRRHHLLLMGVIAVTMLMSIITLARMTAIQVRREPGHPADAQRPAGRPELRPGHDHRPGRQAVFSGFPLGVVFVSIVTGVILILAANTAFNGFPVLGSILAKDGYLPRQLHTRGDRLAFSNGILILAGAAIFLIVLYDAEVTKLIQLYIVGVFVSFTLSQTGMIRHWNRHLRTERDPKAAGPDDAQPRHQRRRRLHVRHGAGRRAAHQVRPRRLATPSPPWSSCSSSCCGIHRHYDRVREELAVSRSLVEDQLLPSRVHAIVLVSKIHKPTLRALAYARATRPSLLEAITVNVEPDETKALQAEWDRRDIPVPLKVLDSPYREITRPVVDYVKAAPARQPARRRRGLHPRVRRRPLVRAGAAQPERAAAQGPAAVHPGRHGRQRAVAAALGRGHRGASRRPHGRVGAAGPVSRSTRARARPTAPAESLVDTVFEVEIGPVAHGGHCVARHDGRVVFVRHTLPGERVRVRVTEVGVGDRFLRGDAVEVLEASPHRRPPPCPFCRARPLRRVRLAARRPAATSASSRPPSSTNSCTGWPGSTWT